MLPLSERARRANPSAILALNARAKALIAQGRDIVLFGAGEPDFPVAPHIRAATKDALERGATRYTPTNGIPALREAIAARMRREQGLACPPDDVIVTPGAKMALYEVFQATCDPGDEVVLLGPCWSSYLEIIGLAGAKPVIVPTRPEDDFQPDPARLREALSPRTRVLLLNSPGNPTGVVLPPAALREIANVVAGRDLVVVSDDIYEKILFDGRAFMSFAQLGPEWQARTVVINGVSKTYAMTGFRIGWAAGPHDIIAAMGRIQDQSTSCATAFAQAGALAALTGPQDAVAAMAAEFQARRDLIVGGLRSIPGVRCSTPGGAFYAFPSIAELLHRRLGSRLIATPADFAAWLLDEFDVALVPGEPFAAPDHVRLSFATSREEIARGLDQIRRAAATLLTQTPA